MIKYEAVKAHVILLEVEIVVDDRLERDSNLGLRHRVRLSVSKAGTQHS